MQMVEITASGDLSEKLKDHHIHNMPEEGEEGIMNNYSSNYPSAWKKPFAINNDEEKRHYLDWKRKHSIFGAEGAL